MEIYYHYLFGNKERVFYFEGNGFFKKGAYFLRKIHFCSEFYIDHKTRMVRRKYRKTNVVEVPDYYFCKLYKDDNLVGYIKIIQGEHGKVLYWCVNEFNHYWIYTPEYKYNNVTQTTPPEILEW